MKSTLKLFLVSLLFVACSEAALKSIDKTVVDQKEVSNGIYQFPRFTIGTENNSFLFNDSKDHLLVTKKWTRISVSKNSFEDKNGKDVSGEIELTFVEYHTTGEIIASKLPMVFKSGTGEIQNFESAGMFEIRAFQKGEELSLKAGKTIKVDLSSENGGVYNFYNFDEKSVAWNEKDTDCIPTKNLFKEKLIFEKDSIKNIKVESPKKPVELADGDEVFDINMDYWNYPNLKDLNGVMWKILEENDTIRTRIKNRLFKSEFTSLRIEPTENDDLEFKLFFVQHKDTISFIGVPVLKGKLLSQQQDKYKNLIKSITSNLKLENKIQDQLKKEKDLLRTFNVDKLGIYNYDRQFKDENAIAINANFTFEGGISDEDLELVSVYLIPSLKKVVIQYNLDTFKAFAINPKENNKIVAVLPNNEIYYLSNKDISKLNLANSAGQKRNIELKKYNKVVKESKQLDGLLAKI